MDKWQFDHTCMLLPMGGPTTTGVALVSLRFLASAVLLYSVFYLAMARGTWYREHFFVNDELDYDISSGANMSTSQNQRALFLLLLPVVAAALGGIYQAVWKYREGKATQDGLPASSSSKVQSFLKAYNSIIHFQFRPLGKLSPLSVIAAYFGFAASCHFAVILIPVARDSKLWSAVGIPFERAVLYHVIAGHLAFATMFLHAFLFLSSCVWENGWRHAWEVSTLQANDDYGDVDVPMGWAAGLCALPMWITSVNYVRRRWYSLFKASHWLFIGVFIFGALHWDTNAIYFGGGLALYIMHVMSRLSAWKRWRYWNRWLKPAESPSPTSLLDVHTTENYTRLVLKNPKCDEPARGGSFVYISVPGALGTDEAHAMSVALRGSPPPSSFKTSVAPLSVPQEEIFTLYVKDLGPWTKALRRAAGNVADPGALLVDVDGFYSQVASFNTMMKRGASRVVIIAGGSGVTSVMGFIQDWCVVAAAGSVVPEVHLAWCCRTMVEMQLVGESIPSMLASAGSKKGSHFTLSLYCTSKTGTDPLSVSWPVNCNAYGGLSMEQVMGKNPIAASLNHSVRILLAGGAAYGAYVLGTFDVARRGERGYHSGGTRLVLMIVCIVSALIVYDWLAYFVLTFPCKDSGFSSAQTHPSYASKAAVIHNEPKQDALESSATTAYDVLRQRVPTRALLVQEAELAKKKGHRSVKVLTSGPQALVDGVLADARAVDWQLFDTEELSYQF
ncbi:ferric reductase [Ectocarpus siliculosus]|uniref:Ferric reductase n=1 Tax=Ectocarpus siliculosus TaxID=2880 RepID=D8LNK5_ECTSI|nr:ferric reductase [Ectocarpus siliculosus]|eukprot:CBN80509.1 ferric reductase [Ectocarpus siliculosus]